MASTQFLGYEVSLDGVSALADGVIVSVAGYAKASVSVEITGTANVLLYAGHDASTMVPFADYSTITASDNFNVDVDGFNYLQAVASTVGSGTVTATIGRGKYNSQGG